jgi:hypothetical protein
MTGEFDWATAEGAWQASPAVRIVKAVGLAVFLLPLELILWLILYVAGVPDAGWVALACALLPWTSLAWRAWTQTVILTRDFVVLGHIVGKSKWVALAGLTGVTFRRGVLTIRARGEHYRVAALPLGASYFSGRRRSADDAAAAIAAAAGLPALPRRKRIIGPGTSLALVALFTFLVVLGYELEVSHPASASAEIGAGLLSGSLGLLLTAVNVTIDHIHGMLARRGATTGP